jgi:hypothetical protein
MFPERELLDRIRRYEDLLRLNKVKFDPLQNDHTTEKDIEGDEDSEEDHVESSPATWPSPSLSTTPKTLPPSK